MSNKCIGCGVILQDSDINKDGYVSNDNKKLCMRCFRLTNYGENKQTNKNNNNYLDIINKINDNDLVVYVSSLLTLNLDFINKFKNVILVLTKRDIMPKSIKDGKIVNYVKNNYKINDIVIVSAIKKYNLDELYNLIERKGHNKKIYFVGSTNSGKSSLINEMIRSYGDGEGNITVSAYPSTTLDIVNVAIGDLVVNDTPGLLIEDSFIHKIDNKDIKKINSKKEIKPTTFQIEGNGSLLIDNYLRIDYETNKSSLTFYMSNNINVKKASLNNPVMKDYLEYSYVVNNNQDLVFSDLGFIKVTNKTKFKIYMDIKQDIRIRDNLI